MVKREGNDKQYGIIAVRFEDINRPEIAKNDSDIHDYTLTSAPQIIGVCHMPVSYEHLQPPTFPT